jgi:hypothetical protein
MSDYLHLEITDKETIDKILQRFDFYTPTNHQTGEFKTVSESKYKNWVLRIYDNCRLEIWGSIHVYHNGNNNRHDFGFEDLSQTIELLGVELGFAPGIAKVRGIEYGVNVKVNNLNIFDKIVCYGKYQVNKMTIPNHRAKGVQWKTGDYRGKIYDKSLQNDLGEGLIRFEKKVLRMREIESVGIRTLSDLNDKSKIKLLGKDLNKMLEGLIIEEPLHLEKLSKPDLKLIENAKNPRFWEQLDKRMRTHYKNRYTQIVEDYGTQQIKKNILSLVEDKWLDLLSSQSKKCNLCTGLEQDNKPKKCNLCTGFEQDSKSRKCNLFLTRIVGKGYIIDNPKTNTENNKIKVCRLVGLRVGLVAQKTPKRKCKTTYVTIDKQKESSLFVSEVLLRNDKEIYEEVKQQHQHRQNKRKRNDHDDFYYMAHNKRNIDSNTRNNLRNRIENRMNSKLPQLFESDIKLSQEMRNLLAVWDGTLFDVLHKYNL